MSTALADDLDEDEIEASLLWTDDEDGDHDNIDPLDEEFLLSEPSNVEAPSKKNHETNLDVKDLCSSLLSRSDESRNTIAEDKNQLNHFQEAKEFLETTLTDEFVDLNVTLNTRDALETSLNEDDNLSQNETICGESDSNIEAEKCNIDTQLEIGLEASNVKLDISDQKIAADVKSDLSNVDYAENATPYISDQKVATDDKSDFLKVDDAENGTPQISDQKVATDVKTDVLKVDDAKTPTPDICEKELSTTKTEDLTVVDMFDSSEKELSTTKTEDLTVVDSFDSSSVLDATLEVTNGNLNGASAVDCQVNQTLHNSKKNLENTKVGTPPLDGGYKCIGQGGSKTKRSLSDEQFEPVQKRSRHSSEPTSVNKAPKTDSDSISVNDSKKSNSENVAPETIATRKDNSLVKKKSIVSLEFEPYCKDTTTSPYICKSCSMKFNDDSKFESHLIANHAMALEISHFKIDLHQYYKQKKEKAIAQGKTNLPKLDGNTDQAIIKEYYQNVKLITAQKHAQYYCKICENIYSTKPLIVDHLRSAKHILRKKA